MKHQYLIRFLMVAGFVSLTIAVRGGAGNRLLVRDGVVEIAAIADNALNPLVFFDGGQEVLTEAGQTLVKNGQGRYGFLSEIRNLMRRWDDLTYDQVQNLLLRLSKTDINLTNKVTKSAKSVNLEFQLDYIKRITNSDGSLIDPQNFRTPYRKGSLVDEFELTEDAVFVRAYDEYRTGSWMFSIEDFKSWGTSATNIKDVLALPNSPKKFALVRVPSGIKLRKGTSAKIWDESFKWGNGGGTQYQIVDFDWQKMDNWFKEVGNLE